MSGWKVLNVSNEDMDKHVNNGVKPGEFDLYTYIEWQETDRETCAHFVNKFMPYLETLSDNPEDVRIVFWFDN